MTIKKTTLSLVATLLLTTSAFSADMVNNEKDFFSDKGNTVTSASYPTDESSHQFLKNQDLAGINTFLHNRDLAPTDKQPIVRLNRDTYYSFAVIDVSKGATITIPELPKGKYVSIEVVTEDHRIQAMRYGAGTFDFSTHKGSHIYALVRLDGTFSGADAAKYQDQMVIKAKSSELFKAEPVNKKSFTEVENALKAQMPAITIRDGIHAIDGMFTDPRDASNETFTQEKYTVGAAIGWAGAQVVDNIYEVSDNYPSNVCHQSTFKDPKNEAFWSITVYNKVGFMFNDVASVNSHNVKPNADGTFTVSYGCGDKAPNNIKTKNDSGVFNLGIRHYRPSKAVIDGYRILPTIKEVK